MKVLTQEKFASSLQLVATDQDPKGAEWEAICGSHETLLGRLENQRSSIMTMLKEREAATKIVDLMRCIVVSHKDTNCACIVCLASAALLEYDKAMRGEQ